MTGRHGGPPVGSAARDATASPYVGLHRTQEQDSPGYLRSVRVTADSYTGPLMCDQPDDCPLGPEPHPFVAPDAALMCCCRQAWEPYLTTYDLPPDDPPRCTSCGHYLADECGCTCCTWTCDERPADV